jgi:hypothetical protein
MLECNEMNEGCAKKVVASFLLVSLSLSSCLVVFAVFARSFGCLKLAPRAWRDSDIHTKQNSKEDFFTVLP